MLAVYQLTSKAGSAGSHKNREMVDTRRPSGKRNGSFDGHGAMYKRKLLRIGVRTVCSADYACLLVGHEAA